MEFFEDNYANAYAVAPVNADVYAKKNDSQLAAKNEARVVAEMKGQVLMAKQFPRDTQAVFSKIIDECQRPTLAEKAVYSFPRGTETVTGPSIRLAEVLARNWGNCTFGFEVLERKDSTDTVPGRSTIRAYAWDLETNMYVSRQFDVKHWRYTKKGGYCLKEDRDIYELESNVASRRMRACILQMIPGDITAAALAACRKTESSGLTEIMKDPRKRAETIAKTVQIFGKSGVTVTDLEDFLNAKQNDWTADHMLKLKETINAIRDNISPIGDFFPRLAGSDKGGAITKEQMENLMKAAKETGKQAEITEELKKHGFSKFADVPAAKYEEIMELIKGFTAKKTETKA
ncbi:MAG: hypothetical protein IJW67_11680 [Blautia sp.]|nr:hypothetical protein [Blautia sp.]